MAYHTDCAVMLFAARRCVCAHSAKSMNNADRMSLRPIIHATGSVCTARSR